MGIKKDLQALTLAGPTVTRPLPDPLAELSLNNWLYIFISMFYCGFSILNVPLHFGTNSNK